MSIEFDFSAVYELAADLGNAGAEAQALAEVVVAKSAADLEAQGKANIVSMGAVDTGTMLNSTSTDLNGLTAEVGPTTNYAVYVHEGTWKNGGPRPFMSNAATTIEPAFLEAMGQIGDSIL